MSREEYINQIAKDLCSKYTMCTCTDRNGRCAEPQRHARIIYDLGYRKVTDPVVESEPTAKWEFWKGWISNHDYRIEDATCSRCGYMHPTVRRTFGSGETAKEVLNKLKNYCPNCKSKMIVEEY